MFIKGIKTLEGFLKTTKTIERLLKDEGKRELIRIGDSVNHTDFYSKKTMEFFINPLSELSKYKLIKEAKEKPRHVYYKLTKKGRKLYYRLLDKLGE